MRGSGSGAPEPPTRPPTRANGLHPCKWPVWGTIRPAGSSGSSRQRLDHRRAGAGHPAFAARPWHGSITLMSAAPSTPTGRVTANTVITTRGAATSADLPSDALACSPRCPILAAASEEPAPIRATSTGRAPTGSEAGEATSRRKIWPSSIKATASSRAARDRRGRREPFYRPTRLPRLQLPDGAGSYLSARRPECPRTDCRSPSGVRDR